MQQWACRIRLGRHYGPNRALLEPFLASPVVDLAPPDGLAILDEGTGSVLDALYYEGSITAGNVNGVGSVNFAEGTATAAVDRRWLLDPKPERF